MVFELQEKYKDQFEKEHVRQIENMEHQLLNIKNFTSNDALKLGKVIVNCAKDYGEDISVRIIRMEDRLPIFQYVGEKLKQRNLNFAMMKYNTVLKTGHCSLWALAKQISEGGQEEVFCEGSNCLPAGGAFPIYVDDQMKAVVTTSGLHNGKDFEVVIRALCKIQEIDVPEYTGILI